MNYLCFYHRHSNLCLWPLDYEKVLFRNILTHIYLLLQRFLISILFSTGYDDTVRSNSHCAHIDLRVAPRDYG